METWFFLAVVAALGGGLESFLHKVTAERKHNIVVLSAYSYAFTSLALFLVVLFLGELHNIFHPVFWIALLAGAVTMAVVYVKVEALKYMDTALYFPIYKVTGPMVTIILGMIFFREVFTIYEWIGLLLSMCVPLLLITKSENQRQKNLKRGLVMLLIGSLIAGIAMALNKYGTEITPNIWLFIFLLEIFITGSALFSLFTKYKGSVVLKIKEETSKESLLLAIGLSFAHMILTVGILFAFAYGGPLGIVYTIYSLYILVPIVLSIIFYNEHWNARKAIAIALSIAALGFLR